MARVPSNQDTCAAIKKSIIDAALGNIVNGIVQEPHDIRFNSWILKDGSIVYFGENHVDIIPDDSGIDKYMLSDVETTYLISKALGIIRVNGRMLEVIEGSRITRKQLKSIEDIIYFSGERPFFIDVLPGKEGISIKEIIKKRLTKSYEIVGEDPEDIIFEVKRVLSENGIFG